MITSTSNQTIKLIRGLRNRKERDASNIYFAEGIHHVGEALRTHQKIVYLVVCYELLSSPFGKELISRSEDQKLNILAVSKMVFESIAHKDGPQGLAVVIEKKMGELSNINNFGGLWVGLDSVQDPGNLGSILRSLDACGGKGMILLDDTTDPFNPTSVRASMGAIFTQTIIKTTLDAFSSWKKEEKFPVVGTVCKMGVNYRGYSYPENMILLSGSEQKGLQSEHLEICDALVMIPMKGSVDSLNLSNATSIILFEILAQHTG